MKRLISSLKKYFKSGLVVGTKNDITRKTWTQNALKELPPGLRLLDAGAGEGQFKKYCEHLDYVSQDFSQYNGEGNNTGLQTEKWDVSKIDIVSDITEIPEPDSSYDAILCTEVFEHIPNPILAIREFSRLLKKDGILIVTAPFSSLTHFAPYHFYSGFNKYFYEMHLKEHGFEIIELRQNGSFFDYLAQELMRLPTVTKRYTKVKPGIFQYACIFLLLKLLNKLSKEDHNSSELLCFGYQVRARKVKLN